MRKSERKFMGAVLMLAFVIAYALIAMALAQAPVRAAGAGRAAGRLLCDPRDGLDPADDAAHQMDGGAGLTGSCQVAAARRSRAHYRAKM